MGSEVASTADQVTAAEAIPSPGSSLGEDIFYTLLGHLTQADIAVLMRVSRAFYDMAIGPLLLRGVMIRSKRQLAAFCVFILKATTSRSSYLRELFIEIWNDDLVCYEEEVLSNDIRYQDMIPKHPSEGMRLLGRVLTHATQLTDLGVSNSEELLQRYPHLVSDFANLPRLRRLTVTSCGPHTRSMLTSLKSSLIEVSFNGYGVYEDPISSIWTHCDTLEKVKLLYCQLRAQTTDVIFSRVRALSLEHSHWADTALLSKAFPNLRYLQLNHTVFPQDTLEQLRAANERGCRNGSWLALKHLGGNLEELFGLAIPRRLKRLEVGSLSAEPATVILPMLHTLISDTTPSHLLLHVRFNKHFTTAEARRLLSVPAASHISHLVLSISLDRLPGSASELQDGLLSMVSALSLTFFVLRPASFPYLRESYDGTQTGPDGSVDDIVDGFHSVHHDILGRRFALASPSLRYISMDVMGQKSSFWAIKRADGGVVLEEIDQVSGRRLLDSEGLWYYNSLGPFLSERL